MFWKVNICTTLPAAQWRYYATVYSTYKLRAWVYYSTAARVAVVFINLYLYLIYGVRYGGVYETFFYIRFMHVTVNGQELSYIF